MLRKRPPPESHSSNASQMKAVKMFESLVDKRRLSGLSGALEKDI